MLWPNINMILVVTASIAKSSKLICSLQNFIARNALSIEAK